MKRLTCVLILYSFFAIGESYKCNDPKYGNDKEWEKVLSIAKSRGADSRQKLEMISKTNLSRPAQKLALTILGLWNVAENTFYSDKPIEVFRPPLKELDIAGDAIGGMIQLKIAVTEKGFVSRAEFLDGASTMNKTLDQLILDRAYCILYCPAKKKDSYQRSVVHSGLILDFFE
jgi:hypothetical protein